VSWGIEPALVGKIRAAKIVQKYLKGKLPKTEKRKWGHVSTGDLHELKPGGTVRENSPSCSFVLGYK